MTKVTRLIDAELRARALSRWEGQGGALTATSAAGSIDDSELRILARSAQLCSTNGRVAASHAGNVVRRARTLGSPGDHARVKKLASFLHEYRSER